MAGLGPFREVFCVPRTEQTTVEATLVYPYGEAHSPLAEGLAHYLEHLAWANMRDVASGGGRHSNALTSRYATAYLSSRGQDELVPLLETLAQSAAPLWVDETYARKERDIVLREYDQRMLDNPLTSEWAEMTKTLYGTAPFGRSVLGAKAEITRFTLDQARRLHDQTHHLQAATLLVKGPLSERDLRQAIQSIAVWPTARATALPQGLADWPARTDVVVERRSLAGISSAQVFMRQSYLRPAGFAPAEVQACSDVLFDMAMSTKRGGLARPLRFDQFVARTFDFGVQPLAQSGLELWLTAEPDTGVSLDALQDALRSSLTGFLSDPDARSFDAIRRRVLERLGGVLDPMDENARRLFDARIAGQPYVGLGDLRRAIKALTFERYNAFCQHLLSPRTSAVRLISPV